jgi:hypothetical protein
MENKLVLELISKNLEEIEFLFENMKKGESIDPLLIEITALKAKTLYQELKLLQPKESPIKTNDLFLDTDKQLLVDQVDSIVQKLDEKVAEISPDEPSSKEEVVLEILETPEEVIPVIIPEVVFSVDTPEEVILENIVETVDEEQAIITNDSQVIENDEPENNEQVLISITPTESEANRTLSDEVTQDPIIVSNTEELIVIDEPIEEMTEEAFQESEIFSISIEEPIIEEPTEEMEEEVEAVEEPVELIEPISEEITEIPAVTGILVDEANEITEKKVLGEQFTKEPSLNDKLASTNLHELKIKAQPILSIKGSIGLNDKFLFTRELFGNDISRFESTIEHLDRSTTILEAIEYLENNFQWTKSDTSLKFMNLVKRRFEV